MFKKYFPFIAKSLKLEKAVLLEVSFALALVKW